MYTNSAGGILSFLKSIDIPAFLDGTSKTLNVINQAIPVFYQVKPLLSNVGTIFKISNALNDDNNTSTNDTNKKIESLNTISNNSPIFYI